MLQTSISANAPKFSRIVAGAWRWHALSPQDLDKLVNSSLDAGISTFDHADLYGDYSCEELFGKVLRDHASLRQRMQLVSKCGIKLLSKKHPEHTIKHYDTSRKHIINSVDNSLRFLATDHLDLLLLHRPDPLLDPHVVAETFDELKQSGKVLCFGVSNFNASQFELLQKFVREPLVTNQIELSLFKHNLMFDGTIDTLMKHQVSPMAWSPLGGGKYFEEKDEIGIRVTQGLNKLSEKYNQATPSQLLLAWLLMHPAKIFPIIGTSKSERLVDAAMAVDINLSRPDWFEMLKWITGKGVA